MDQPGPSMHRYTPLATLRALRLIFEENRDKSFEVRWALAKSSEAYRGFQVCCAKSARILLVTCIPPLLMAVLVHPTFPADSRLNFQIGAFHFGDILIALGIVLYVALCLIVSWRLGTAAADKKRALHR